MVRDEHPVGVRSVRPQEDEEGECPLTQALSPRFKCFYLLLGTESLTILVRANRARALGSTIR